MCESLLRLGHHRHRCVNKVKRAADFGVSADILGDGWEDSEVHDDPDDVRRRALEMGTNIVFYGLIR